MNGSGEWFDEEGNLHEGADSKLPIWVEFSTTDPIVPTGYVLTTGDDTWLDEEANEDKTGRRPKNWSIYAKLNSSADWEVLATVENDNSLPDDKCKSAQYSITNDKSYQYFRFEISAIHEGDVFELSELQLLEVDPDK